MDGKNLLYALRQILNEDSDSYFLDDFTSYRFLNDAALDLAKALTLPRGSQEITTVADQADYDLNQDFLRLYLKNHNQKRFITYNNGSTNTFLPWKAYEDVILADQGSKSVALPSNFTVFDKSALDSRLSGTATSDGASAGGECSLADTGADFSDVWPGDTVHNTTDGSMGIVLSKTSTTVLVTALFGGTADDWSTNDAYVIQPSMRYQLKIDPPPSTAGHTVTVEYIQVPGPVYSDYGVFRLPAQFFDSLVQRAAWAYKYRDSEPNFGDAWWQHAEQKIRDYKRQTDMVVSRPKFIVNLMARR